MDHYIPVHLKGRFNANIYYLWLGSEEFLLYGCADVALPPEGMARQVLLDWKIYVSYLMIQIPYLIKKKVLALQTLVLFKRTSKNYFCP